MQWEQKGRQEGRDIYGTIHHMFMWLDLDLCVFMCVSYNHDQEEMLWPGLSPRCV